ncbi:MAG: helix-turn-helix domain-containing protein [Faecalibacillus sp.]
MGKLSIGEMAKLNQISIQTLRLYDEMDILKPIEVNQKTGYRYYDMKQCAKLDMIRYMKSTGMTLKEIKEIFEQHDLTKLNLVLHQHLKLIDQEIKELRLQKKAVKKMIDSYNRYLKSPQDGTITLEYIEDRKIYSSMTDINFYDFGIEVYENILKDLKHDMEKQGIPEVYYYNAGTTIFKDDFVDKRYLSNEIFVFVDQDCISSYLQILPANMYACVYCDDFDKEKEYIGKLYDYIQKNKMLIIGDYICEVLTELPITKTNKREMFLRLQVPVTFVKK